VLGVLGVLTVLTVLTVLGAGCAGAFEGGGMKRRLASASAIAFLIACAFGRPATTVAVAAAAPAHGSCADLASIALTDTTIPLAEEVKGLKLAPSGSSPINNLPPFCRVAGVTKPAIKFEVWLPLDNWNGKFQGVGNGANAGSISYPAMATAIRRGYA